MKKLIQLCSFVLISTALMFGTLQAAHAETAVVVHPSNGVELTKKQISRIFLGKLRKFPGGDKALPVNLPEGSDLRVHFDRKILKKSPAQIKSYWSIQLFTGKGTPPQQAEDSSEVKALVGENPNLIGFIDASEVDESVRVVFSF